MLFNLFIKDKTLTVDLPVDSFDDLMLSLAGNPTFLPVLLMNPGDTPKTPAQVRLSDVYMIIQTVEVPPPQAKEEVSEAAA